MKKPVDAIDDKAALTRLMANAKRLGNEEVYSQAFRRRCELEGIDQADPMHRDLLTAIAAYEGLLEEKHGHRQPASYTRRKLKDKGAKQCLIDWALGKSETDGFKTLKDRGLIHLTGEYVVVKYADRFAPEVVAAAERRLAGIG